MNLSAPRVFTAAEIARALGLHRQGVARQLEAVKADGAKIISRFTVRAWSFAALPAAMQSELDKLAACRGMRGPEALLASPGELWAPSVPLAEVAPVELDNAVKLQRALARMLEHMNDPRVSSPELERIGLDDYAREFGHTISDRYLRKLFRRTVDRDGGICQFARLEIYLPESPARKNIVRPAITLDVQSEFRILLDAIASFKNPAAPSLAEKSYLWLSAFETFEIKVQAGEPPKKLKRALLQFLERNAPFLVSSDVADVANSLRVNFQNKYAKWLQDDRDAKALADGRARGSGNFRAPELSEADRNLLTSHAVMNCGGRVAQAWRELVERRALSENVLGYYLANPADKSYVPKRIEDSVRHEVASMYDIHHGPRQAKLNGPHVNRDWSGVSSMDWLQGDDFTFPVLYREQDQNGNWEFMRGQTLLMIDVRSTRILGFVLISSKNYNSRAIRSLITRVCGDYGLPRKGFYFEHSIWEKSKILTGDKNAPPLSWGETRMGLREFGLVFKHADLPRGKLIERVGGAMQDLMEGLPGYVGRNEILEKFERLQKLLPQAKRGEGSAIAQFMLRDEWLAQLEMLCERYNQTIQNGKLCDGMSPDQVFDNCQNFADPLVKFSAHCSYLLANDKVPVTVRQKGILIGKTYYYGQSISHLIGHRLLAWFDPENPEFITVTNLNRENPLFVPYSKPIPAMDATPEEMAAAQRQAAEFQSHTKNRYRILKAIRPVVFRPMLPDAATVELGREMGEQRAAVETAQRENTRRHTKARQAAGRLGMSISQDRPVRPETAAALESLNELLQDETPDEKGQA